MFLNIFCVIMKLFFLAQNLFLSVCLRIENMFLLVLNFFVQGYENLHWQDRPKKTQKIRLTRESSRSEH